MSNAEKGVGRNNSCRQGWNSNPVTQTLHKQLKKNLNIYLRIDSLEPGEPDTHLLQISVRPALLSLRLSKLAFRHLQLIQPVA